MEKSVLTFLSALVEMSRRRETSGFEANRKRRDEGFANYRSTVEATSSVVSSFDVGSGSTIP